MIAQVLEIRKEKKNGILTKKITEFHLRMFHLIWI